MILQGKHFKDYERYLVNLDLVEVTIDKYLLYLKHYRELYADHLNQKTIDAFLKLKTSPNHRAMIKHLIDSLKRDDTLSESEQVEISRLVILKQTGRKERKRVKFLLKEEVNKLVNEANLNTELDTIRFKLMVLWQFSGAFRIHEIVNLRFSMLKYKKSKFYTEGRDKLKHQKITLPTSITKGEKEGDVYVQTNIFLEYFDFLNYLKENNPRLLYRISEDKTGMWGITKEKYSEQFRKQAYKVLNKEVSTHSLRHGRCTDLLLQDMPVEQVSKFMRHENIATTTTYLHLIDRKVEESLEKIN